MSSLRTDVTDLNNRTGAQAFLDVQVVASDIRGAEVRAYRKQVDHVVSRNRETDREDRLVRDYRVRIPGDLVHGLGSGRIGFHSDRAVVRQQSLIEYRGNRRCFV